MGYKSALYKAKGSGSAKEGSHHWLMQRVTAIALIPLIFALMYYLSTYDFTDFEQSREFIQKPAHALGGILLYIAAFYHGYLGITVVIEDYIHKKCCKITALITARLTCFGGAIAGIFSILSIYLKG